MSSPDQQQPLGPSWVPPNSAVPPEWKQPAAPKPGLPKGVKIAGGVLGGLILVGGCNALIAGGKDTDRTSAPAPTTTVTVTRTVTAAAAPPAPAAPAVTATVVVTQPAETPLSPKETPVAAPGDTVPGSGTYLVGDDIKAGTYKTAGPARGGLCYWERGKDATGGFESIIANENLTGQGVVTIKSTDKVFKTQGCQDWVKSK
ncbi:hypothetical protein [Kitasatospora sp. NPDC058218]|uniref:hypothetical protein n=1 Tax=Kitasatospora sp. NPDC058218 TaxID=3346385 RepID=UPI0036D9A19C